MIVGKKKKLLWIIEDSRYLLETRAIIAETSGFKVACFEDASMLGTASGNPDYILMDVGSIGSLLTWETVHYTSILHAVRNKFPGTTIYIHSAIDDNAHDLVDEMSDKMILFSAWRDINDLIERLA